MTPGGHYNRVKKFDGGRCSDAGESKMAMLESMASVDTVFEGGHSKKEPKSGSSNPKATTANGKPLNKEMVEAGKKVKKIFSNDNPLGDEHVHEVGNEMRKHGSTEKTGFMEKEAEFVENLRKVQENHIQTCIRLLQFSIVVLTMEFFFACFCIVYFGCGFGKCENNLICCVHFIKFM